MMDKKKKFLAKNLNSYTISEATHYINQINLKKYLYVSKDTKNQKQSQYWIIMNVST